MSETFNFQRCESVEGNKNSNEDEDVQTVDERTDKANEEVQRPISSYSLQSNGVGTDSQPWYKSILVLPEELILERGGKDALYYLRFQRHIIVFLFIVTFMSICIILPINLQGRYILLCFRLIFGLSFSNK